MLRTSRVDGYTVGTGHQGRQWFHHHEGQITASIFKAAVNTNPCMPFQTLVNGLPDTSHFILNIMIITKELNLFVALKVLRESIWL